jgi:hypothetical protein
MGRQVAFHMFPQDVEAFLTFVQERDDVFLTEFTADTASINLLDRRDCFGKWLCLWNRRLLTRLDRRHVREASPTHRVDDSLPVLEFTTRGPIEWAGRAAAAQGRPYAFAYNSYPELREWYQALAGWIRRHSEKNPVSWMGGYVGPEAIAWHHAGGFLLPQVPPVNSEWMERVFSQHP